MPTINSTQILNFLSYFLALAGYIIGLGAVTVIDLHGFLGRKSHYWTRATISAHKVTKPLIWVGTILALIGSVLTSYNHDFARLYVLHTSIFPILIINGVFLSFVVSPFLLKQEHSDKPDKLLPKKLQKQITLSFIVSVLGWWGSFILYIYLLSL